MWRRADDVNPTEGQHPLDFGWVTSDSGFQPLWFSGSAVPCTLGLSQTNTVADLDERSAGDDDASSIWSEDSVESEDEFCHL